MCHSIVDPIFNGENAGQCHLNKQSLWFWIKKYFVFWIIKIFCYFSEVFWQHVRSLCKMNTHQCSTQHTQRIKESIKAPLRTRWHLKITMSSFSFLQHHHTWTLSLDDGHNNTIDIMSFYKNHCDNIVLTKPRICIEKLNCHCFKFYIVRCHICHMLLVHSTLGR